MDFLLVLLLGFAAGTVSGIVGVGSSIMLMPPLAIIFGARQAVPIMAVAALMANVSRGAIRWARGGLARLRRLFDHGRSRSRAGRPHAARPSTKLRGGHARPVLPAHDSGAPVDGLALRIGLPHLAIVGAVIGFLTGIVVSTGPINAPFFLAYGLVKGAYLGSEALGSPAVHVGKAVVFRSFGALPIESIAKGLIIGCSLMAGSLAAKGFVLKLDMARFLFLMEAPLLASGVTMLWAALA